jgi:hypothetical protein
MHLKSLLISTAVVMCAVAATGAYAQAPAGSTGECKDGTYSSADSKRGACSGHGGVKTWYADQKAAAPAAKAPAAATPAAAAPAPAAKSTAAAPAAAPAAKPAAKPTEMPTTAAAGGGAGKVWVNTSSKVYHCQGDKWYGKTKQGEYMTEAAAKAAGNHADHGKACS